MRLQILRALPSHNFTKAGHPPEATSALERYRGLLLLV